MDARVTNSIEIKTSCAVEKAERETPTDLEHMENDELRRMRTCSTANKSKSDQPEEATMKEQRVDDIVMDQGPTLLGRKLFLNCLFAGRNNN